MAQNKSDILVRPLTLADQAHFAEGLSLLNRTQGDGMFQPGYIEECIANKDSAVFAAFVSEGGVLKIIGLGVAKMIDDYEFYAPFADNWNEKFAGKKVGSFSTMAVNENFQGQGIGQKISHERLAFLKSLKADYIVGISWVSGLKHTSDRVFEKMGFKKVKVVPNLFSDYSLKNPFICPVCGKPPCNCDSAMYIKEL